jgi:ketosteroid isomerase-like protein
MGFASNKELVEFFFSNLWSDPEACRRIATEDVTWITTRSMPIPGAEHTFEHVGWDAVMNVATAGLKIDTGYLPETMEYPVRRFLEAEQDHVVFQFTMTCKTKAGKDYINDYLFLVECRDGKVARFQEYWDSKQAYDLLLRHDH